MKETTRPGFWAIVLLLLFLWGSSLPDGHAGGFIYDGRGLTTDDPDQQMKDHICLATMVFLEARGDGEHSQLLHGQATINRVLTPRRWRSNVCEVIMQPGQYESISPIWVQLIEEVQSDDNPFAIDDYIDQNYLGSKDRLMWRRITHMTYWLITAETRTEDWVDADHFYAPDVLERRGQRVPGWVPAKTLVAVAGTTHFLK